MFFECFNQPFLVFLWYCISLTLCQRTTNSQKCPKLMLHATIFNDSQYKWSNQKFGWFNCRLRNAFLWVNICVHNNLIELTFFSNWTLLSCAQTKMSFVFFNVLCILIEFKSLGFCGTSLDVKNFLKGECVLVSSGNIIHMSNLNFHLWLMAFSFYASPRKLLLLNGILLLLLTCTKCVTDIPTCVFAPESATLS